MTVRPRILLAGACLALAIAGCGAPATTGSTTAPAATTVSQEQQQQAQQLAEEAEKIMLDPALAPRDKYPKALAMFRDALKIDPDNALAKKSITLIEDIYKSMGRPVPQPA